MERAREKKQLWGFFLFCGFIAHLPPPNKQKLLLIGPVFMVLLVFVLILLATQQRLHPASYEIGKNGCGKMFFVSLLKRSAPILFEKSFIVVGVGVFLVWVSLLVVNLAGAALCPSSPPAAASAAQRIQNHKHLISRFAR